MSFESYAARIEAAIDKAENGSEILFQVANGDEFTEVSTTSGPVPSVKKWFLDNREQIADPRTNHAILEYSTYAEASAAAATLPDGQEVEVAADESREGARMRYKVQGGALVFSANLDQLRIDLSAAGGAGLVGYLPAGDGAVASSAQTKLREFVSVKDFGAVGDGVTDDRPAFQAAIDYLNKNGISGRLIVPQPPVQYAFKSTHASGHGVVLPQPTIQIFGDGYTQVRADVPMTAMFYVSGLNSNFVGIQNLILNCNNNAQNGFDALTMGTSLTLKNVIAYDALQDGIVVNYYSSVLEKSGAFRSGRHNIRTVDGTTSIVMVQAMSGSISHAYSSIKLGRSHYSTLISPFVDGANLGIEYGDAAMYRAQSITIIEPGFENIGKCLKITNAGLNLKGGYLLNTTPADFRFEFTNATVTLDSDWAAPEELATLAGTSNLYSITSGETTFLKSVRASLITANNAADIKMPIVVVAKPRDIYINGSTGNDFNAGSGFGDAIKTWDRLNEMLSGFVDQNVNVIITSTSMPSIDIAGFTARNGATVNIQPGTTCTIPGGTVKGAIGGGGINPALVFQNLSFTGEVTVVGSNGGVKFLGGTYNAAGTTAYTIRNSFAVFMSHACTAATNFILAFEGANVHSKNTSGTASNLALYADEGARITKSGTVVAGAQQAVNGGQII